MPRLQAFILLLCAFLTTVGTAQTRVGLRLGIGSSDLTTEAVSFNSAGKDFTLALEKARYSLQAGLFLQVRSKKFVFQPEVLINSSRNDYRLAELNGLEVIESTRKETFQSIDVPIMFAYKLGPLRIQGGPLGQFYLFSTSDFDSVEGFEAAYKDASLGYQAGIGFDLWNVLLDFKYQGGFTKVGDHLSFAGQRIDFGERPGGLLVGLGFSFN